MVADDVGKAYALFRCEVPLEEIREILPYAHDAVEAPKDLELKLYELNSLDVNKLDEGLGQYVNMAKDAGINYGLIAELPGASNEETAREVSDVLNQMYQSNLFDGCGDFRGELAYKADADNYVLLD